MKVGILCRCVWWCSYDKQSKENATSKTVEKHLEILEGTFSYVDLNEDIKLLGNNLRMGRGARVEEKGEPNRLTTTQSKLENQTDCSIWSCPKIESKSIRLIAELVEANSGLYL